MDTAGTSSPAVKRPWREADYSPPSSVEVKNARGYTSTPKYAFMTRCLMKHSLNKYNYVIFVKTEMALYHRLA